MVRKIKQLLSKVNWIRSSFYAVHEMIPAWLFSTCVDLLYKCSLSRVIVRGASNGSYKYTDGLSVRFAADRLRGLRLWYRGFDARDKQLHEKYGLGFIDLRRGIW